MRSRTTPSVARALREALRGAIRAYGRDRERCVQELTEEAVHDLRVDARHILAASAPIAALRGEKRVRTTIRLVRRIVSATGALRDTQVLLELMRDRIADAPACREFYEVLIAEESRLKKQVERKLASGRIVHVRELESLLRVPNALELAESAAGSVQALLARTKSACARYLNGDEMAIHAGRQSARLLRYMLEAMPGNGGTQIEDHVKVLREVQDAFGAMRDVERLRERLESPDDATVAVPAHRKKLATTLRHEAARIRFRSTQAAEAAQHLASIPHGKRLQVHASVYLVRHAIAEERGEAFPDDRLRPLSKKGRVKMKRIAEGIDSLNLHPAAILTSPYSRAAATARILSTTIRGPVPVRSCAWLRADAGVDEMLLGLEPFVREGAPVFVVGHEPQLQQLVSKLTGGVNMREPLRKGGLCKIDLPSASVRNPGVVAWTLTPKQLLSS